MGRPVSAVLVSCALLLVVLFCIPEFREGLVIGKALVRNTLAGDGGTQSAIHRIAKQAERDRNAKLMAYAALRTEDDKTLTRTRQAIALDPRYTWLIQRVCQRYRLAQTAECGEMIAQLEAWDGNNAVPFLLEAQRIAWLLDPQAHHLDTAPNDERWHAVMAKAFAASHYDSYGKRYAELQRSVYIDLKAGTLADYVEGLAQFNQVDRGQASLYERKVLVAQPQQVIDYSRRVIAGADNGFDQMFANFQLTKAYRDQNTLHPGSIPTLQIEAEERMGKAFTERERSYSQLLGPLALTFQLTVLI